MENGGRDWEERKEGEFWLECKNTQASKQTRKMAGKLVTAYPLM